MAAFPVCVRIEFGDGLLGEVRYAADITVGIAGRGGTLTASVLEADIPASLR